MDKNLHYCTRTIRTQGFYILNPLFECQKCSFKEVFQKILPLCMVSIQDQFVIKTGYDGAGTLYEITGLLYPA